MALPEKPFSRKEQYLSKIAGQDTEIPEEPFSREEMYLDEIARNGGGGGGTSDFDQLSNRPSYNGVAMTGTTNIPEVKTYSNFVGTDGQTAGVAGLVPAPATTDADKYLKADGTWATAGGGGGDTVYSTTQTSAAANGGAVYIGNKNASQVVQTDPNAANTYRYFYALPYSNTQQGRNGQVCILGTAVRSNCIAIGDNAKSSWDDAIAIGVGASSSSNGAVGIGGYIQASQNSVAIGKMAMANGQYGVCVGYTNGSGYGAVANYSTALGANSKVENTHSVALGAYAQPTRVGEVNVGLVTGATTSGYNGTAYRVIGGVHDGINANDAVTVGQISNLLTAINSACGTSLTISNGVISNSNNANNNSNEPGTPDDVDPSDPSDPSDPGGEPGPDEPAPEDEPGPE